ncbi:MAG: hypothetical protein II256_00810, partial [Bacteroidales bacterium]|nr:hypothetical protein [Bacteroidales bacterium]
ILFLLFNILGKWTAWHLAGFGYFSFLFFPVNASGISILIAALSKDSKLRKKYIWRNIIALVISMAVTIFSYFVSCSWFW